METVLITVTALAISMVVIPVMLRLAPRLGLVDRPSARKVHSVPMARVGGWGIVLGSLAPLFLWLPLDDPLVQSYLFGALVLLAFGTWDDSREVGHYPKFIGQLLAVVPVVLYGDLWVSHFPFMGTEPLPEWFGKAFTVVALVGVINAINHSDGLDGLAGGEALLSLIAILLLGYQADGGFLVLVTAAVIGGVLGFLRYNTHPARLFMGDAGSQFLGFTVGFAVVLLTQRTNPALSAMLPALLLGLPVVDIITVLAQRMYQGMNWFKASRNHIHHRLLDLGFDHYESVVIIYSVQAFLVGSGVVLCYSWDWAILLLYLLVTSLLFIFLVGAKARGWRADQGRPNATILGRFFHRLRESELPYTLPRRFMRLFLPAFLVAGSLLVDDVPRDFGLMAVILLAVLALELFFRRTTNSITTRAIIYAAGVFLVYLSTMYPPRQVPHLDGVLVALFWVLAIAIAVVVRTSRSREFQTTPMDYLIALAAVVVAVFTNGDTSEQLVTVVVVKGVVLLYSSEYLLHRSTSRWNGLSVATAFALGVLALRGLVT